MLHNKLWIYNDINDKTAANLAEKTGIPKLMAKVFLSRGMDNADNIKKFLSPSLDMLYNPFLLKDMDRAVERVSRALKNNEKIVIYGDYDVDGVTSTSVLYNFLISQGASVNYYIPDRVDEGYGLSTDAIDRVRMMGAELIITVDCGITAFDEVKYCSQYGIDIIITDHHECKALIPEAYAVVNPCRPDCEYPFKKLAGVGIAFKFVHAMCIKMGLKDQHYRYLDLVALGTVADVVELIDENRAIVKHGMAMIAQTSNLGLQALINISGLKDKPINSFGISYIIAPRVNAAGRVGDAGKAVRLFTTSDFEEANEIAFKLQEDNKYRQDTEAEILSQVEKIIESEINIDKEKVIVVSGEGWHHGVIGIVASKITEKYYRPSILISNENGIGKGSGRSIEGFNLFKALTYCEDLLEKFGGHELAAGLSLSMDNFGELRRRINEYAGIVLSDNDLLPRIRIDSYIRKDDISLESIRELDKLAPFGAGNPEPRFAYSGFTLNEIRTVGDNKHLKLQLGDNGFNVEAIGFNMGNQANEYTENDVVDAVFSLEINTWNSIQKIQLNLKDIKFDSKITEKNRILYNLDKYIVFNDTNDYNIVNGIASSELMLERCDLVAVYQYIRSSTEDKLYIGNLFAYAKKIAHSYKICMNYFKLKKSLEIFNELNLLKMEASGEYGMTIYFPENIKRKANLEDSHLYRKLQALKNRLKEA
jgi:single-stranded-DNA-specific exonuclease